MFDGGSRYARVRLYASEDPERASGPIEGVDARVTGATTVRRMHRFIQSERLDLLAWAYYGDPRRYWVIADGHDDIFPCDLEEPGRLLQIPLDEEG